MNRENILALVKEKIIEVVPSLEYKDIHSHLNFQDLGTNSMERMEIIVSIIEELSLDIPRIELLSAPSLCSLAELLECKLQVRT